jgi:hypothetical protein
LRWVRTKIKKLLALGVSVKTAIRRSSLQDGCCGRGLLAHLGSRDLRWRLLRQAQPQLLQGWELKTPGYPIGRHSLHWFE